MFRSKKTPEALHAKDARLEVWAFDMDRVRPTRVVTRHGFREHAVLRLKDSDPDTVRYAANVAYLGLVNDLMQDRFTSDKSLVYVDTKRQYNSSDLHNSLEWMLRPEAVRALNPETMAEQYEITPHHMIVPVAYALRAAIAER